MANCVRSLLIHLQNKLRTALLARDGRCLITDKAYHRCTASHIVPYSRPDVGATLKIKYKSLLTISPLRRFTS